MGDFFQENKRFLVIHFAGALVFLIAWLIVGALFDSDIAKYKNQTRRYRAKAQQPIGSGTSLRDKENEARDQAEGLRALKSDLARSPKKRFTLEGQTDPDLWYNQVGTEIEQELVEACARRNIEVDSDLGRPGKYPNTPRQFAWYLRGLEMVDQVLRLCIKAHDDVLEEGIARVDGITITTLSKRRAGSAARIRPFIVDHGLELTIVGHPTAIAFVVEELSREMEGQALLLENARFQSLDLPPGQSARGRRGARRQDPADRGRVEARLKLRSIEIDEQGKPKGMAK